MKALLIIDESIFPVRNGSGAVYRAWLSALKEHVDEVALLIFSRSDAFGGNDPGVLRAEVGSYLVVPAEQPHIAFKLLRSLGRSLTGGLFSPAWIEALGRGSSLVQMRNFISAWDADLIVVQKLGCSVLLDGVRDAAKNSASWILDVHDDFVTRELLERRVLDELMSDEIGVSSISALRKLRTRHRITRFHPAAADAQEKMLMNSFDVICIASDDEAKKYEGMFDGGALSDRPRIKRLNWGFSVKAEVGQANIDFHAGIIASDAPFNLEGILYFMRSVLPLVKRAMPEFKLLVAGSSAKALDSLGVLFSGVTFLSWVDNLDDYYESICVALVPLCHGTGVSIKTVEAVSYGVPVVTTMAGVRGLSRLARDLGEDVCSTDAEFAERILEKIRDRDSAKKKAIGLRQSLASDYSHEKFSSQVGELINEFGVRALGKVGR